MEFLNGFEQIFHVGWDRYLGICCAHKIFFSDFPLSCCKIRINILNNSLYFLEFDKFVVKSLKFSSKFFAFVTLH